MSGRSKAEQRSTLSCTEIHVVSRLQREKEREKGKGTHVAEGDVARQEEDIQGSVVIAADGEGGLRPVR